MKPIRSLVVFFSRTGQTKQIARMVADAANADIDELEDTVDRRGILGFLRSSIDARLHRLTTLRPGLKDPAEYDLVFVGGPVWSSNLSTPVRTYLTENSGRLPKVAFFLVDGGRGDQHVEAQMAHLAGREPVAQLIVRDDELLSPDVPSRVRAFVRFALPTPRLEKGSAHRAKSPPTEKPSFEAWA